MKGLKSTTYQPAFNLATEEYLLRHTQEDVFFLYTNAPSIIVGKHQNTLREINYSFVNENNIPIYRRLSGGGTVYHDYNNLNFCFIKSGEKGQLVNFERYSEPILLALKALGINAAFGKRHDIQINGKKVSGNASHVYKNRVMHHGTLLFKSDLSLLNKALKNNPMVIQDKAVKSVRSEVANIASFLEQDMEYSAFVKYIFDYLLNFYTPAGQLQLSTDEISQIEAISGDKYSTWEWNYGYSPNFELNRHYKLKSGPRIKSRIRVEKGIVTQCELLSSDENLNPLMQLMAKLTTGCQHTLELIEDKLFTTDVGHLSEADRKLITRGFFS
ncbi:lipoate--protein ligase family protein [Carboxylicivirga taeanensis]|uniref:lipoate--protein ligase family protein n=1 Tax=Carboxylicivirga taeanensis TaxID=1416875 RepID=UPI003F6E2ED5